MRVEKMALSHCPTLLGVGTVGQGTAETGGTAWDKWDKWDRGTLALGSSSKANEGNKPRAVFGKSNSLSLFGGMRGRMVG
jgi:hypothetical protein